jgi:ComF family protein
VPSAGSILVGFIDLVAPLRCPGCNDRVQHRDRTRVSFDFCEICESQLEPSVHPDASHTHIGPMARAIQRFKYEGRPELARPLARRAAEGLLVATGANDEPLAAVLDRVVPVPLHASRRVERGYDQAALLARELAAIGNLRLDVTSLRRVRSTGHQVGRSRDDRRRAVRSAFAGRGLEGARVLLVDDVVTTGATFDAAERACLEAGALRVVRLAIAAAPT